MARHLTRLKRLESQLMDCRGLVPHSDEWFSFWDAKLDRLLGGEDVDLAGMTLEFVDAVILRGSERC